MGRRVGWVVGCWVGLGFNCPPSNLLRPVAYYYWLTLLTDSRLPPITYTHVHTRTHTHTYIHTQAAASSRSHEDRPRSLSPSLPVSQQPAPSPEVMASSYSELFRRQRQGAWAGAPEEYAQDAFPG